MALDRWVQDLMQALKRRRVVDFSGLGIVFYQDRKTLPVHPLVSGEVLPKLPAVGFETCVDLLAEISRRDSPCHDGFVLIRTDTRAITDVSQFLAPPIPKAPLSIEQIGGARYMAARLASLMDGVEAAAISTQSFDTTYFELGTSRSLHV